MNFRTIPNFVTQFAISNRIDNSLQKEKAENLNRVNILLLGIISQLEIHAQLCVPGGADAGKSTIVKQMRFIKMMASGNREF